MAWSPSHTSWKPSALNPRVSPGWTVGVELSKYSIAAVAHASPKAPVCRRGGCGGGGGNLLAQPLLWLRFLPPDSC